MAVLIPFQEIVEFKDQDCFVQAANQTAVIDLPRQSNIKRILIIKWGGMGDVVISTAIIEDIYNAFPNAEIHLNAMPPWQSLFEADPRFSKVWTVDLRNKERGIQGSWRWLTKVIKHQYDLIIDLQTNDRSRMLLSLLKFSGKSPKYLLGNHPVFPYNVRQSSPLKNAHSFQIMRRTLAAAGIATSTTTPMLYSSQDNQKQALNLLESYGLNRQPFAIFLCGSHAAGLAKRWGVTNFVELANQIKHQGIYQVVLVGGADEAPECDAIAQALPDLAVNLCGKTSLLALPTIFQQAKLIIANDTGTAHLAAASGTPMLIICGPTNPLRVKPIGAHVLAIQPEIECKNCYQKTCSHHSCMRGLTADKVIPFLENMQ